MITLRRCLIVCSLLLLPAPARAQDSTLQQRYRAVADRLIDAALADSAAYARLTLLVDNFGNRLSGSASLERAVEWIQSEMRKDGLANVRSEPVMVPHWVRGEESAELVQPRAQRLPMLGLGGSIATPRGGITAEVLVVSTFEELQRRAAEAKGKIVLFDAPFTNYGATVRYRVDGAVAAARVGAVASLIRSVTPYSMRTPHTGVMTYDSTVRRIPHAAITVEDAEMLHRMQDRGEKIVVHLTMNAQTLPDAPSHNVMGEVTGWEHPEQVVVLGGHIDSWDVGEGAMDDGGGMVAAWEAVRLIQKLGLHPRRTIRAVGWTNEENGSRGGEGYQAAHTNETHILAIESDGGVFRPLGFGFTGPDTSLALVKNIAGLLHRIGSDSIRRGGGGSDIEPLMQHGVPGMGLNTDGSRYFWFHHTDADTIDKLDPQEVGLCVATMAVIAYVVADMPDQLPH